MSKPSLSLRKLDSLQAGFWLLTVLVVVLLFFCLAKILDKRGVLTELQSDAVLLEVASSIGDLLHDIQKERGLTIGFYIRDKTAYQGELLQIRSSVDDHSRHFKYLKQVLPASSIGAGYAGALGDISGHLSSIPKLRRAVDGSSLSAGEIFAAYSAINTGLLDAAKQINFYIKSDTAIQHMSGFVNLLRYKELLGKKRAIHPQTVSSNTLELEQLRHFVASAVEREAYLRLFLSLSDPSAVRFYQEKIAESGFANKDYTRAELVSALKGGLKVDPRAWWDTETARIDLHQELEKFIVSSEKMETGRLLGGVKKELYLLYASMALLILIQAASLTIFMKRYRRSLKRKVEKHGVSRNSPIFLVPVALVLVVGIGLLAYFSVRDANHKLRQQAADTLIGMVTVAHNTLKRIWLDSSISMANHWASDPVVLDGAKALLQVPLTAEQLKNHGQQQVLRDFFEQRLAREKAEGIFIVSRDYRNLASMIDANLGVTNVAYRVRPEALKRAFAGKPSLIPPVTSDVLRKNELGVMTEAQPIMFVATPIFDETGEVLAVLMVRLDPRQEFSETVLTKQIWNSVDTYAFDRQGRMLTNSNFEGQLYDMEMLAPGTSSILNIMIREPVDHHSDGVTLEQGPFTMMAERATRGQNGSSMQAYPDYRGIPVMGAWLWDAELDIGIATEVDESDVIRTVEPVSRAMMLGFAILLLLIAAVLVVFYRLEKHHIFDLLRSLRESGEQKERAQGALTELQKVQAELRAIVDTAADGVLVINGQGLIQSANPAVEDLFGYPPEELLGKNVSMLMPEPDRRRHDGYLEHYHQTEEARVIGSRRELLAQRADGNLFPIELSVSRLEFGTGLHFAGIIRDVSERRKFEEDLIQARDEAEQADMAKSTFLATMSHEIRTPLNGIVGTIDMLKYTGLGEEQLSMATTAEESASMLKTIIDGVLDFSKIEAGRLEIEHIPVSLTAIAEETGDALSSLAREKNVELLIYCEPALPGVMGDPVRLKQILFNLIGNALKFTESVPGRQGRVLLSISAESQDERSVAVVCEVRDNGIGMSTEVQNRLFKPFMQGEESITRRFGGTGLGLVITRRLVELMGGDIHVVSEQGKGSTFSISLPLEKNADADAVGYSDLRGLQILLIETEDDVSALLEKYLRHAGAEVELTPLDLLLEKLGESDGKPAGPLVIVDSRGDEIEFSNLQAGLRQQAGDIDVRYVMIKRRNQAYTPRNDDTVVLDINAARRSTILNAVAAAAGRESPELNQKISKPLVIGASHQTVEEAKADGRLILLADDNTTNQKVIKQQLTMLGYQAELADDGKQALDRWREGAYGLVMTDCHMPEMDGYELARSIRNEEKEGVRIPIVAITADAMKGTAEKCLAAGMDVYLTKPMALHQIKEVLEALLPDVKTLQRANQEEFVGTGPLLTELELSQTEDAVDPSSLSAILGMDDPELLLDFYMDYQRNASVIRDELQAATSNGDLNKIGELMHSLKSTARTVGANALADCCLILEQAGKNRDRQVVDQQVDNFHSLFEQVDNWIEDYRSRVEAETGAKTQGFKGAASGG